MPRVYTADEKATALQVYVSDGLAEAWRQTGIPKPTIASWARRAGFPHTDAATKTREATEAAAERAALLRERVKTKLLEKADDLLDRMDAPHVEFKGKDSTEVTYPIAPAGAVQNYATSVGILIDKFRLESGEATDRTETRRLTEGFDDHETRAIVDAAREYVGRARPGQGEPVAEDAAVGTPETEGTDPAAG